jgi:hypothetical protein
LRRTKPADDAELWQYIREFCGKSIPRTRIVHRKGCRDHLPPFAYVSDMFFDRVGDCLSWACRGGGKTNNAAILTVLEHAHMPGLQTRILGGSEHQSRRTYEEIQPLVNGEFAEFVEGEAGMDRTRFRGGGKVEILSASPTSVLGHHVPRLRLDEVDEFDKKILGQAIGTSMTDTTRGYRGRIEIYSTFHNPYGCMSEQIMHAHASGVKIYQWCIFEVLERCGKEHACNPHSQKQCILWPDCQGVAKRDCDGYVKIADAIRWKALHTKAEWDSFYLCKEPYRGDLFLPDFDSYKGGKHIPDKPIPFNKNFPLYRTFDWGTNGPTVCLWIQRDGDKCYVIDEMRVRGKAASDAARDIKDYHIGKGYGNTNRDFCDPSGMAFILEFKKWGFHPVGTKGHGQSGRLNARNEGWDILRRKLCSGRDEVSLFISPACPTLIRELANLHYPESRAGQPIPEDCAKVDDHGPDALRYALMGLYPNRPWMFISNV